MQFSVVLSPNAAIHRQQKKKIDSLYSNAIPCHPASERCHPLSIEGKKFDSLYCNVIPCHPAPQPMTCDLILHATSLKFSVACFHIPYLQKENMYMQGGGGGLTAQGRGGADSTGGGGG